MEKRAKTYDLMPVPKCQGSCPYSIRPGRGSTSDLPAKHHISLEGSSKTAELGMETFAKIALLIRVDDLMLCSNNLSALFL
jgi:hypothetical protein